MRDEVLKLSRRFVPFVCVLQELTTRYGWIGRVVEKNDCE